MDVTSQHRGSLETFGGPQRHAIAHLKAGKVVIPNMFAFRNHTPVAVACELRDFVVYYA